MEICEKGQEEVTAIYGFNYTCGSISSFFGKNLVKSPLRFFSAESLSSTPCHAANKAAASGQILFLVGDVLHHKNMFLDTLFVQGLLAYKTVVGL